jgi:thiamine biosynthesis lipoprotein
VKALAMLAVVVSPVALIAHTTGSEKVVREVYLMGTRATLAAWSSTRAEGLAILERALGVLEGTEAELSTWRGDSVISRLNRQAIGTSFVLPHELCDTFAGLYEWHAATAGRFDPAIGPVMDVWGIHAEGRVPPEPILREALAISGLDKIAFDRERCAATRRANVRLDVGAFGKGDALDRVERALGDATWMIDLGGQVSVRSSKGEPRQIAIAHPRHRDRALLQVGLTEGSLSTSAGSERDLNVNGRRIAHIIDPRTGQPAAFEGSVVVWHRRGLVADILSTALYVMGPDEGLRWAEERGIAACYLVPEPSGRVTTRMSGAFKLLLDGAGLTTRA